MDYPGLVEVLQQALAFDGLRDEAWRARRVDLDWGADPLE